MQPRRFSVGDIVGLGGLALLLGLHFWFPYVGAGLPSDTYATSREGKKAFYRLLDERGHAVSRRTEPFAGRLPPVDPDLYDFEADGSTDTVLCLLGPARMPHDAEWRELLAWVERGGVLLVAGRIAGEDWSIPGIGMRVEGFGRGIGGQDDADGALRTDLVVSDDLWWESTRRVRGTAGDERLVAGLGGTQALLRRHGRGRLIVVASDFVFTNEALAWGDDGVLAYRLATAAGIPAEFVFDESLNISGTPKVVGLLFDPQFRPATLQLLVCLWLFGWWGSRRFGPVQPPVQGARQNLVDHTDTVGAWWYRGAAGEAALKAYRKWVVRDLGLRGRSGPAQRTLETIARRLKRDPADILELLRRAHKTEQPDRKTAASLVRRLAIVHQAARAGKGSDAPRSA